MAPVETEDMKLALETIREICATCEGCAVSRCPAWDGERCICAPEDMSPCSWVFPWDADAPLER